MSYQVLFSGERSLLFLSVTLREGNLQKPYQSINTSYPIRKTWWLYLLLPFSTMPKSQVNIRMPPSLIERLRVRAEHLGLSFTGFYSLQRKCISKLGFNDSLLINGCFILANANLLFGWRWTCSTRSANNQRTTRHP
jgi:hypothetical protein